MSAQFQSDQEKCYWLLRGMDVGIGNAALRMRERRCGRSERFATDSGEEQEQEQGCVELRIENREVLVGI
ncbi:hypothetical protein BIY21_18180 [Vibrio ponticus]|uniref:Uncharacterized protein n=1 Tax=Vibrio ponticus TaxID=265668 RepID=A0ABX3F7C2_9VIBR|nr:hypothetical protein BIY21_18180 [Vibrio ponticus]